MDFTHGLLLQHVKRLSKTQFANDIRGHESEPLQNISSAKLDITINLQNRSLDFPLNLGFEPRQRTFRKRLSEQPTPHRVLLGVDHGEYSWMWAFVELLIPRGFEEVAPDSVNLLDTRRVCDCHL